LHVLLAVLPIVAGVLFLRAPVGDLADLTRLVACFLMAGGIFTAVAVLGYRSATASVGTSDRNFVTIDPAVADLRTKMRNLNATFVSQLSVKSGLTSRRRDNVSTGSHRRRG
jgi:hypothetical protein